LSNDKLFTFYGVFMCDIFMDSTIIGSIIGVSGILIGTLAGSFISRKSSSESVAASNQNAIDIMRRQDFNRAASEFRIAFIKEQRLLAIGTFIDKPNNLTVQKIVADSINRHEIAMIRFKPFVCKSKIRDYEKAWKEYTGNSYHFEQYAGNMLSGKDTMALSRIEKLLKFANPK